MHVQKIRVEPPVSSRGLQLGLVLVDTMLVAGVGQARTVAAVGAVDEVLLIKESVSKINEMEFHQEAIERCRDGMPCQLLQKLTHGPTVLMDQMERESKR